MSCASETVRWARAGRVLGLALLAALALALLGGAGKAQASCIYNTGESTNALAFNFSSTESGLFGYSSSGLAPGANQCWYGVGWSNGTIRITGSPNDLVLREYFGGIDVAPHGWVNAYAINQPEEATWEACATFVPAGGAHLEVFGESGERTVNENSQLDTGNDCFGLSLDDERANPRRAARAKLSEFVIVTGPASGAKAKSVTIHVYGAGSRKALGSVCLPSSGETALALRASRKAIFVGATANRAGCAAPRVADPERRGTPRPDRRYSAGCYRLREGLRIVRYPDDFSAPKRANCLRRR